MEPVFISVVFRNPRTVLKARIPRTVLGFLLEPKVEPLLRLKKLAKLTKLKKLDFSSCSRYYLGVDKNPTE